MASTDVELNAELLDRDLGGFCLYEILNEGGYGTVYRARQPKVDDRIVVVKVLHQRLVGRTAALGRFNREARTASRFRHSYAAHVYAYGVEHDGLAWLAMEYVAGSTLRQWLKERGPMPLEQVEQFLERLAEVIQAMHAEGIVHRDLKPENIMIVDDGGRLTPKLLDFGIAQMTDAMEPSLDSDVTDGHEDHVRTAEISSRSREWNTPAGFLLGTPAYTAPEQWLGDLVWAAADRYALGVVLYEMITGRVPFDGHTQAELREQHLLSPVPPLGGRFPSELDAYFARALAKRPEARFGSAVEMHAVLRSEIAATLHVRVRTAAAQWHASGRQSGLLWRDDALVDLERWRDRSGVALSGIDLEFAVACFAARDERDQRSARRRRAGTGIGFAAIVGGLLAGQQWYAHEARMEHERAELSTRYAELSETIGAREQGRQALLFGLTDEAFGHLLRARTLGDRSRGLDFMLARAIEPRLAESARLQALGKRMWSAAFSPDGAQIVTTDDLGAQIWDARTYRQLHVLPGGEINQATYSFDGAWLATTGDGAIKLWSRASGALLRELRSPGSRRPHFFRLAIAPDSQRIAAIADTGDPVVVWDVATGAVLAELHVDAVEFPAVVWSGDGRWLAATGGAEARVFDATTWKPVATIAGHVRGLAFDPTGPRLLTGTTEGDASLWSIPSGARLRHLREVGEPVDRVAFAPSGALLATTSRDGAEQIWDAGSGKLRTQFNTLHDRIFWVEFDSRGELVLAAGGNGTVVVSETATGATVASLTGPTDRVLVAHFDPSSRLVVGASWDGTARLWNATAPYRRWGATPIAATCGILGGVHPDARFVAAGCSSGPTRIWDTARDELLAELPPAVAPGPGFAPVFPAVSPTGEVAAIARGAAVELYTLPGGRRSREIHHAAAVSAVAVDDDVIVSGAIDGSVFVTRGDGDPVPLSVATTGIDAVLRLADGRVLVADARELRVFDDRGRKLATLALPARMRSLRPSPDGRRLIAIPSYAGAPAPLPVWDLDGYRLEGELAGNASLVLSARWADDRAVIAGEADGTARLWDVQTRQVAQTFRAASLGISDAVVDPTRAFVVAAVSDGSVRFFDIATGRPIWTLPAHKTRVVGLHFEGNDLVTRGFSGEMTRWTVPDSEQVIKTCVARGLCGKVGQ